MPISVKRTHAVKSARQLRANHSSPPSEQTVKETIRLLGIGVSWGGTRSLIAPMSVEKDRTVTPWTEKGTLVRISIGHPDVPALTALAHLGRTDAAGPHRRGKNGLRREHIDERQKHNEADHMFAQKPDCCRMIVLHVTRHCGSKRPLSAVR
jgi:hypothetical protein